MSKEPKKQVNFSETEFYFDDCPICKAMEKAEDRDKDLSFKELNSVFIDANKKH